MGSGRAACHCVVEVVDWIHVAFDTTRWQVLVNMVTLGSMKGGGIS
jgi:hypothetical protein